MARENVWVRCWTMCIVVGGEEALDLATILEGMVVVSSLSLSL